MVDAPTTSEPTLLPPREGGYDDSALPPVRSAITADTSSSVLQAMKDDYAKRSVPEAVLGAGGMRLQPSDILPALVPSSRDYSHDDTQTYPGMIAGPKEDVAKAQAAGDAVAKIFGSSFYAQQVADNGNAKIAALSDAITARNAAIKQTVGADVPHPFYNGYWDEARQEWLDQQRARGPFSPPLSSDAFGLQSRDIQLRLWQRDLQNLASKYSPNTDAGRDALNAIGADRSPFEDAQTLANQAQAQAAEDYAKGPPGSMAAAIASFLGSGAGSYRDPVADLSLLLGPGKLVATKPVLRIAEAGFKQGLLNAGITLGQEPAIQDWRNARGQESGFVPALKDVAVAAAFGFIPGAGIEGAKLALGHLFRAGTPPSAEEIEAFKNMYAPDRGATWRKEIDDFIASKEAQQGTAPPTEPGGGPPSPAGPGEPPIQPTPPVAPGGAPAAGVPEPGHPNITTIEGAPVPKDYEAQRAAALAAAGITKTSVHSAELDEAAAPPRLPGVPAPEMLDAYGDAVRHGEDPERNPPPLPPIHADPPLADTAAIPADKPYEEQPGHSFEVSGKPVTFGSFDPKEIGTDADTFQYKGGSDVSGVTDRLKGVAKWDTLAAGKAVLYQRDDGSIVVADGHQRLGLAKRIAVRDEASRIASGLSGQTTEPTQSVKMDGYLFKASDGWTPAEVRAVAAKKNIQEGSGDALDTARILRDNPAMWDDSLPISDGKLKQAKGLAELSDPAWGMALNDVVPMNYAALVGRAVPDKTNHAAVIADLAKFKPQNENEARMMIAEANAAGFTRETQQSLFGPEEATRSLMGERARVYSQALSLLSTDQKVFSTLDREASRIEAQGNVLVASNASRAERAAQLGQMLEKLATRSGPVSAALNRAAQNVADGGSAKVAARSFVDDLTHLIQQEGLNLAPDDLRPEMTQPTYNVDTPAVAQQQTQTLQERVEATLPDGPMLTHIGPGRDIFDHVRNQLLDAGFPDDQAQANAAIVRAYFETDTARRGLGEDPMDLYFAENLQFRRGTADQGTEAGRAFAQSPRRLGPLQTAALGDLRDVVERLTGQRRPVGDLVKSPARDKLRQERAVLMSRLSTPQSAMGAADRSGLQGRLDEVNAELAKDQRDIFGRRYYQFAGEKAETADVRTLDGAKRMEEEGADRAQIWHQTGWYRGKDDKWRFEINDSQAHLTGRPEGALSDVLNFPALFEAYPWLHNVRVERTSGTGNMGQWNPDTGVIQLDEKEQGTATILHEVQHAIQNIEGMSQGNAPDWVGNDLPSRSLDFSPHEVYHNTAGEVEARNVETRRFYSPQERRWITPWQSADVPEHSQIRTETILNRANEGSPIHADMDNLSQAATNFLRMMGRKYGEDTPMSEWGHADQNMYNSIVDRAIGLRTQERESWFFQPPTVPTFFSAVERAVTNAKQAKASPEQWLAMLKNTAGVKPEEMNFLGLPDWLREQKGQVTREQVADYVRANNLQLQEVTKKDRTEAEVASSMEDELAVILGHRKPDTSLPTKYSGYTLPGAVPGSYREMLLTLPEKPISSDVMDSLNKELADAIAARRPAYEIQDIQDRINANSRSRTGDLNYRSSHWDEPNVIAHIRLNDRVIDGKKTLFVEEIQSDAAQDLRRGKSVPSMPFIKGTDAWTALALKRILRHAAENGYEKVAWAPGSVHAERYDLSKQVEAIRANKNPDGTYQIGVQPIGQNMQRHDTSVPAEKLEGMVGKDLAEKIINEVTESGIENGKVFSGLDLKVGGSGMTGFYDRILPAAANKLVKKFGAKVGQDQLNKSLDNEEQEELENLEADSQSHGLSDDEKQRFDELSSRGKAQPIHSIDITPALRDAAMEQGFPLFQGSGAADAPRGRITFTDTQTIIDAFESHDPSTIPHELGHMFLKRMAQNAADPRVPQQMRDDFATALRELGAASEEDITREQHEQFADWYLQWLRSGKAPSSALAHVFAQFRQWLEALYRNLKAALGSNIPDAMRGVFDRLHATDEEIAAMRGQAQERAPEAAGSPQAAMVPGEVSTSTPEVNAVLVDPYVAQAIREPKINRDHDVPYGAGPNNADDLVTNVDRHVPATDTVNGVTYDPAIPVVIHEQVEKHVLTRLTAAGVSDEKAYPIAHFGFAEVAERAWVDAHLGPEAWPEYQAHWTKWLAPIDHENPKDPPPDLYQAPYPHDDDHLAAEGGSETETDFEKWGAKNREKLQQEAVAKIGPLTEPLGTTLARNPTIDEVANHPEVRHAAGQVEEALTGKPSAVTIGGPAAVEPGAEGKPQTLIPGVEPVTDRDRLQARAGKPLLGSNAPPVEGGLFDEGARAQNDLFDAVPISGDDTGKNVEMVSRADLMRMLAENDAKAQTAHDLVMSCED